MRISQPLVSIIIPSFNRPEIVKRAIKSAIGQTYKNKEIIVVDDGSTVVYNLKGVKYFRPWNKNKGGSAARNYGIKKAKGKYIVFIDDDNVLGKNFLKYTVPVLEESDYDAVITGRFVKYDDRTDKVLPIETAIPAIDWGWLIHKRVFKKVLYDESIWGDEDADFGIQFIKNGFDYTTVNKYLQTAYAFSEQDATANTFPNERRLKGLSNFLDKNLEYYGDANERRYILRLAGRNYLRAGYYTIAITYFWKSFMCVKNWRTFKHFLFALRGWECYNLYMTSEEKRQANV